MIPILYEKDEVHFQHNGLGQLSNVIVTDTFVHEAGNGFYELQLTYPIVKEIDGYENAIWKELKLVERQILYKPSHSREPHAFRIYDYDIDSLEQTITVYAQSRAYDLAGNVVKKLSVSNATPQQAMNQMKNNLTEPTDFDFYSDMSTTSSTTWEQQSGLSTIMGEEGSLIQYWGGEVLRENTRISLYNRIGKDNVTTLRIGKNIDELNYNLKTDGMVTAIIPFYRYTPEGENREEVIVNGNTVKSSKFNSYRLPYYQFIEYTEEDGVTDLNTLNQKASNWFKEHPGADEPELTITVAMTDVAESTEYAEILRKLETVNVFDTVSVYVDEFDIDLLIKVASLKYDGVSERNLEVELGTPSSSLFEAVVDNQFDSVNKQLDEVRKIGVIAQISADGKNTNYQGSVDPNVAELIGDEGDIYFRTVGTEKQMWQYQGNQWNLILDTSRIDVVEKQVDEAVAEIKKVEQSANDAVAKADTAIQEAGFAKVDASTAVANAATALNTAQTAAADASSALINAGTALDRVGAVETTTSNLTTYYNELTQTVGAKADKSVVDGINRTVTTHTSQIEANAEGLLAKADKSLVDTLKGTVDSHSTQIQLNAEGLDFKADKSLVDTINQTVSNHTNEISTNAQAINARLTETQINTLLNGKDYVNQTTLNATARGLSGQITQVSTDLSNLEIGGRNLLLDSKSPNWLSSTKVTHLGIDDVVSVPAGTAKYINPAEKYTEDFIVGESYTFSFLVTYTGTKGDLELYAGTGFFSYSPLDNYENVISGKFKRVSKTVTVTSNARPRLHMNYRGSGTVFVTDFKVEKGTKATDWTPAPEDMATLEKVVSLEANINGLQTTVANKAEQSQVTQLAGQVSSKVESATYNSKMTQLDSAINLRVQKGDVITQINAEAKRLLFQSNRIYLDADTVTFSGSAFIPSAAITSLSADKVNTGTLNAANVRVINLDFDTAVGNRTTFVQSAWNSAVGGGVSINGSGIVTTAGDGSQTYIQDGIVGTRSPGGTSTIGQLGYLYDGGSPTYLLRTSWGSHFKIRNVTDGSGNFLDSFQILSGGSETHLHSPRTFLHGRVDAYNGLHVQNGNDIRMSGGDVIGAYGYYFNYGGEIYALSSNSDMNIKSTNKLWLHSNGSSALYFDSSYGYMKRNLSMEGNKITNQSDRRLKNVFGTSNDDSLEAIKHWEFVDYEWKDPDKPKGIHLGLIAQDTPELMVYEANRDMYSIDSSKQTMMNSHAIQQLANNVVSIETIANGSNTLASQALSETQQLKNRVTELENEIKQLKGAVS